MTSLLKRKGLFRKLLFGGGGLAVGGGSYYLFTKRSPNSKSDFDSRNTDLMTRVPSRFEMIDSLKSGKQFDVLVIGGGATGTGIALVRFSLKSNYIMFYDLLCIGRCIKRIGRCSSWSVLIISCL